MKRLSEDFYTRDVLVVAPELLGKYIVMPGVNVCHRIRITEVEAYRGEEDLACHASKGRTRRTEIMYHGGGHLYIYLVYGMYWMLNVVTGEPGCPQAVLIRGIEGCPGPGRLTKFLGIDKSYYGENLLVSNRIGIYDNNEIVTYSKTPRIGIDYAGEYWRDIPWRFVVAPM